MLQHVPPRSSNKQVQVLIAHESSLRRSSRHANSAIKKNVLKSCPVVWALSDQSTWPGYDSFPNWSHKNNLNDKGKASTARHDANSDLKSHSSFNPRTALDPCRSGQRWLAPPPSGRPGLTSGVFWFLKTAPSCWLKEGHAGPSLRDKEQL